MTCVALISLALGAVWLAVVLIIPGAQLVQAALSGFVVGSAAMFVADRIDRGHR
jgi:hypothetical protein